MINLVKVGVYLSKNQTNNSQNLIPLKEVNLKVKKSDIRKEQKGKAEVGIEEAGTEEVETVEVGIAGKEIEEIVGVGAHQDEIEDLVLDLVGEAILERKVIVKKEKETDVIEEGEKKVNKQNQNHQNQIQQHKTRIIQSKMLYPEIAKKKKIQDYFLGVLEGM